MIWHGLLRGSTTLSAHYYHHVWNQLQGTHHFMKKLSTTMHIFFFVHDPKSMDEWGCWPSLCT